MVVPQLRRGAMKVAPHASMVLSQLFGSVYTVLSKVILVQGISSTVFNFYQFMVATIFMGALAFFFERRSRPLNKGILIRIFLMALLGVTFTQNMLTSCLYFISATIEVAIVNMIPVVTYTISVVSRQERLELNTWWGRGKLFGTLLSVCGALTLMLWHGPTVVKLSSGMRASSFGDWIIGLVMVFAGVVAYSCWIILLRPMMNLYPAEFSLISLMFSFSGMQQGVIAAIVSNRSSQWKLKWNLELLNIFVGGLLNTAVSNLFITWCSSTKGPIFVASFTPLCLVFTTILETTFLQTPLHVGSVVGSIAILAGLYVFLWSKAQEETHHLIIDEYESIDSS